MRISRPLVDNFLKQLLRGFERSIYAVNLQFHNAPRIEGQLFLAFLYQSGKETASKLIVSFLPNLSPDSVSAATTIP